MRNFIYLTCAFSLLVSPLCASKQWKENPKHHKIQKIQHQKHYQRQTQNISRFQTGERNLTFNPRNISHQALLLTMLCFVAQPVIAQNATTSHQLTSDLTTQNNSICISNPHKKLCGTLLAETIKPESTLNIHEKRHDFLGSQVQCDSFDPHQKDLSVKTLFDHFGMKKNFNASYGDSCHIFVPNHHETGAISIIHVDERSCFREIYAAPSLKDEGYLIKSCGGTQHIDLQAMKISQTQGYSNYPLWEKFLSILNTEYDKGKLFKNNFVSVVHENHNDKFYRMDLCNDTDTSTTHFQHAELNVSDESSITFDYQYDFGKIKNLEFKNNK